MELQSGNLRSGFLALYKAAEESRKKRQDAYRSDPLNRNQLPILANEANIYARLGLMAVWHLGRTAAEAKMIAQGRFGEWIETCDPCQKTINNAMAVYEAFESEPALVSHFPNKSTLYAAARIQERERRRLICNRVERMRYVKDGKKAPVIRKLTEGEIGPDDPEVKELIKENEQWERASDGTRRFIDDEQNWLRGLESTVKSVAGFADKDQPKLDGELFATKAGLERRRSLAKEGLGVFQDILDNEPKIFVEQKCSD